MHVAFIYLFSNIYNEHKLELCLRRTACLFSHLFINITVLHHCYSIFNILYYLLFISIEIEVKSNMIKHY